MIFTKIAIAGSVVLLGFLCFLAAKGMTIVTEGLVTVVALFAFIAGGNLLSGRGGHGGHRPAAPPVPTEMPGAAAEQPDDGQA